MARIVGVELQDNWKVDYALTRISGVGWPLSEKILDSLKKIAEMREKLGVTTVENTIQTVKEAQVKLQALMQG